MGVRLRRACWQRNKGSTSLPPAYSYVKCCHIRRGRRGATLHQAFPLARPDGRADRRMRCGCWRFGSCVRGRPGWRRGKDQGVDSYTNILTVKLFARARDEDQFVRRRPPPPISRRSGSTALSATCGSIAYAPHAYADADNSGTYTQTYV